MPCYNPSNINDVYCIYASLYYLYCKNERWLHNINWHVPSGVINYRQPPVVDGPDGPSPAWRRVSVRPWQHNLNNAHMSCLMPHVCHRGLIKRETPTGIFLNGPHKTSPGRAGFWNKTQFLFYFILHILLYGNMFDNKSN